MVKRWSYVEISTMNEVAHRGISDERAGARARYLTRRKGQRKSRRCWVGRKDDGSLWSAMRSHGSAAKGAVAVEPT